MKIKTWERIFLFNEVCSKSKLKRAFYIEKVSLWKRNKMYYKCKQHVYVLKLIKNGQKTYKLSPC